MSTPTATNPTGITEFDVTPFAQLPEWHRLTRALNNVIEAANRRDLGGQHEWMEALRHHATALPYADCCSTCAEQDGHLGEPVVPAVVRINGGDLNGTYVCTRGHAWTCYYNIPATGQLL